MSVTTPQRETVDVEEAARRLGIGRTLAYEEVRQTGQLAGIRALRIGRRYLIPTRALDRVLSGDDSTE